MRDRASDVSDDTGPVNRPIYLNLEALPCRRINPSACETVQPSIAIMTTYIPSLTLPTSVFQHSATSVLLPIALGTAIGYSTRRT